MPAGRRLPRGGNQPQNIIAITIRHYFHTHLRRPRGKQAQLSLYIFAYPRATPHKFRTKEQKRYNVDLRFDFKVNNELTVFAKGSYARRKVDDTSMTLALGGRNVNPDVTVSPTYQGAARTGNASGVRSVAQYRAPVTTCTTMPATVPRWPPRAAPSPTSSRPRSRPMQPPSRAVHHQRRLREYRPDPQRHEDQRPLLPHRRHLQERRPGGEILCRRCALDRAARAKRVRWSYGYGPAVPVAIPAYTANQQPLSTQAPQLQFVPRIAETEERTAKADFSYALGASVPFFSRIKAGFNLRETSGSSWGAGGNEAAGAIGQFSRPAGYTPDVNGAPNRPAGLIDGWTQIDLEIAFALSGIPNVNFDCVKQCAATDGKVHQQTETRYKERATAVYEMTDFSFAHLPFTNRPLPFGLELDGNFGYRVLRTKVQPSGTMGYPTDSAKNSTSLPRAATSA